MRNTLILLLFFASLFITTTAHAYYQAACNPLSNNTDAPFYCFDAQSPRSEETPVARAFPILDAAHNWSNPSLRAQYDLHDPTLYDEYASSNLVNVLLIDIVQRVDGVIRPETLVMNKTGEKVTNGANSIEVLDVIRVPGYSDGWLAFQDGKTNKVVFPKSFVYFDIDSYHSFQKPMSPSAFPDYALKEYQYVYDHIQPYFNGFVAPPGYGLVLVRVNVELEGCFSAILQNDYYPYILSTPYHGEVPAQWFYNMDTWVEYKAANPYCPQNGWLGFAFSDENTSLDGTWFLFNPYLLDPYLLGPEGGSHLPSVIDLSDQIGN
jgi:hypothetical protein